MCNSNRFVNFDEAMRILMAQPARSAEELQLGRLGTLPCAAGPIRGSPTAHPPTTTNEAGGFPELSLVRKGGLLKSPVRENCTGGVAQPAFLPRCLQQRGHSMISLGQ